MDSKLCIMNIGAHPADVVDDAGGTTILHTDRGDRVVVVTLTRGSRVHDKELDKLRRIERLPDAEEMSALLDERAAVKRREVTEACSILGVEEVHFLEYDEEFLRVSENLVLDLAALIRSVRPDIIITHFPLDNAGVADDHATCGQITLHALNAADGVHPGDVNPPHRVAQVFFRGIPSAVVRTGILSAQPHLHCDIYIDISDVVDRKVRAVDQLASQGYTGSVTRKMIETFDGILGYPGGVPYAEAFIRAHPETYRYLPLEESTRKQAQETEAEYTERRARMWVHALPVEGPDGSDDEAV